MRLLNFSVGRVRSVEISGETVRTAHVKEPVAEPWTITEQGALGDERAVHPDKLYAFARAAYDYWGRHLGTDPALWSDGFFGENLTVDTLDEHDVRVGDVFSLGDSVRLVVSGARTPCVKLAWRLGQPRTFQRVFAASRNTGVYLDVLEPGVVRPGDTLTRIHQDTSMPSVADLCDYVQSQKPPPIEPLKKLLAFERLSPVLRYLLGFKLDAAERAAGTSSGRWMGWREFVIDSLQEEAPSIRSVLLRPLDGNTLCQQRPGQFVTVRMPSGEGQGITRTWSLSHYSEDVNFYRLTVRLQGGEGSNWIHQANRGDAVMLRAPSGGFVLDTSGFRPVVLVAAGIGITPLMAMLQAHLARPNPPSIYLIYGVRSPADVAFRATLDALTAKHAQLRVTYAYSRISDARTPVGRINADLVIRALSDMSIDLNGHRVALPWYENDTYICGPTAFCASLLGSLVTRGANADRIFSESFAARPAPDSDIQSAQIQFVRSGVSVAWDAGEDLSLLELAERAGLSPAHDCRAGACLTCKTRVVEGITTADLGDGSALICMGRPQSACVTLDL